MNTLFQKMRNNRVKLETANKYALKRWDEDVERQYLIRVELEQDASRNTLWGWNNSTWGKEQSQRKKAIRDRINFIQ